MLLLPFSRITPGSVPNFYSSPSDGISTDFSDLLHVYPVFFDEREAINGFIAGNSGLIKCQIEFKKMRKESILFVSWFIIFDGKSLKSCLLDICMYQNNSI